MLPVCVNAYWSCAAAVSELPCVPAYAAAGLCYSGHFEHAQNDIDRQQQKQHTALQALHQLTGQSPLQARTYLSINQSVGQPNQLINLSITAQNGQKAAVLTSSSCACFYALQEALTRICTGTAHYSATRTLNSSEQPLFAAAAKAQCDLVAPYAVSCHQCIYPQSTSKVDVEQATKALREVIQVWDQEQAQKKGDVPFFKLSCTYPYIFLVSAVLFLLNTLSAYWCTIVFFS